ncbi:hypothetical protein V2H45_15595 [Tumidithrix elongata RA019]|uniref:PEP-CTERM sorting domain-containing protein n=1 Tax=Tumidithrix elongata BACA0141 TaxID=2716417 RepID=A0AAW9PSU1_9CYAN|nr:hypothetical protein [Tumidithrix elongata RA019]
MVNVVNRCLGVSIGTGLLSIASLGLGASLPASAASLTTWTATWSGAEFSNTSTAKATFTTFDDIIDTTSPLDYEGAADVALASLNLETTVNGIKTTYVLSQFAYLNFNTAGGTLNYNINLVGQNLKDPITGLNTGKTWNSAPGVYSGDCTSGNIDPNFCVKQSDGTYKKVLFPYDNKTSSTASYAGDFNLFKIDPGSCGSDYPNGVHRFILAACDTSTGNLNWMRLTSFTKVQPVPVPGVMFGAIAAGVYFSAQALRKKKASSLAKSNA